MGLLLRRAQIGAIPKRPKKPKRQADKRPTRNETLADARQRFIDGFGRKPGPGDPVHFDPDFDAGMVTTMIRAEVPEPLIYAFIRTDGNALGGQQGPVARRGRGIVGPVNGRIREDVWGLGRVLINEGIV